MINGVHAIFYTTDAEATRAFLRDKLDLPGYDAMPGWTLFTAEADIGSHPADSPSHAICFRCDDLKATVAELERRGVTFTGPINEQQWGFETHFVIPGVGEVQIYEPKYERPA
jgi:catechol 2,3-dioxygenase-like lactoylglutathione lyase family enzyme